MYACVCDEKEKRISRTFLEPADEENYSWPSVA